MTSTSEQLRSIAAGKAEKSAASSKHSRAGAEDLKALLSLDVIREDAKFAKQGQAAGCSAPAKHQRSSLKGHHNQRIYKRGS